MLPSHTERDSSDDFDVGTRVAVYGSLRSPLQTDAPLPLTKYSIPEWDYGGVPAMIPYQAPNVTAPQNDVNFFTSDILPYGTYTLTINVTTASSGAPFYLDYIAVEVPGPAPSSSTPSSSLQTSASSTPTHLPAEGLIPQHHRPIGAIVGGVLAGVLGIVGAFFVFFCYMRQKRRTMMPPEYDYGHCTVAQKGISSPPTICAKILNSLLHLQMPRHMWYPSPIRKWAYRWPSRTTLGSCLWLGGRPWDHSLLVHHVLTPHPLLPHIISIFPPHLLSPDAGLRLRAQAQVRAP